MELAPGIKVVSHRENTAARQQRHGATARHLAAIEAKVNDLAR